MTSTRSLLAAAVLSLSIAAGGAQAAELILNGSFETGDFTDWHLTGNSLFVGVTGTYAGVSPEQGSYQAFFGNVGSNNAISQSFADVSGDTYSVSVWMASQGGVGSDFGLVLDYTHDELDLTPAPVQGYTDYTFTFVGTGHDTLSILDRNDPSYNLVDNVSVTGASPVPLIPEPASWALMIGGLGLTGAALRRRRLAAVAV